MAKRAYIIHGLGGNPEGGWKPWLKRELEARGYAVEVPGMPDAEHPRMEAWLQVMQLLIKQPDGETVLIGHSLGGNAVLRFLASCPAGTSAGKAVLVAPAINLSVEGRDDIDKEAVRPWFADTIDAEAAKKATAQIVGFFSDNDEVIPLESATQLRERFGAKTIIEHDMGHYSSSEGVTEVPTILAEILRT